METVEDPSLPNGTTGSEKMNSNVFCTENKINQNYNMKLDDIRDYLLAEEESTVSNMDDSVVKILVEINKSNYDCIIDTGSQITLMSEEVYNNIAKQAGNTFHTLTLRDITIVGIAGKKDKTIKKQVLIEITVNDKQIPIIFLIAQKITANILIGCETLRYLKAKINLDQDVLTINYNNDLHRIPVIKEKSNDTKVTTTCKKEAVNEQIVNKMCAIENQLDRISRF